MFQGSINKTIFENEPIGHLNISKALFTLRGLVIPI